MKNSVGKYAEAAPTGVLRERCSENMQQLYRRIPIPKCDFNKVAKQLYSNHNSAWVFSCKFATYFWNTFPRNTSRGLLLNTISYRKFRHLPKQFHRLFLCVCVKQTGVVLVVCTNTSEIRKSPKQFGRLTMFEYILAAIHTIP